MVKRRLNRLKASYRERPEMWWYMAISLLLIVHLFLLQMLVSPWFVFGLIPNYFAIRKLAEWSSSRYVFRKLVETVEAETQNEA
jgi:hypothetical protein